MPSVAARLPLYASLTRLDKPVGTLLLLWPTLTALWIAADGAPGAALIAIFAAGTFLMRSAGCAVNDAADAHFDSHVKRTAERVVARGLVSRCEALVVAAVLAIAAAMLLPFLNITAVQLALVAVVIAATYPLAKRFIPIPQLYLGVAFSFGIPMAFAAVLGTVPAVGWLLMLANAFWVIAYDTEYAMVDRDDDLRIGIKSSAIFFGRFDVFAIMVSYLAFVSLLVVIGRMITAAWPFYAGCAVAAAFAIYHFSLIRTRSRDGCMRAFRHNNWVGAAVFIGTAVDYALR
ncbi:MAG TPA: 4-hydroxybenzoate octaprenyltransferase [Burkholderiaceae bacterium]|nr:4-hydroxybenzoate octaprenyltransferase [Burkholderiaceae bacterium]